MTKWQYTNHKGEQVMWYSADVVEKLKKEVKQIGSDFIKKGDYARELEQENNLLKQTLKDKNFVAIVEENAKLKQQLEIDKNQINYFIEENEKLKHKNETILKRKKDNCTCEDCYNEGLWEGMAIGSYEEVARLKHTLQEIKEIASFHTTNSDNEDVQNDMNEILTLIKKAEEE